MKENKIQASSKHKNRTNHSPFFMKGKKEENLFFSQKKLATPFFKSSKKATLKEDKINSKMEQEALANSKLKLPSNTASNTKTIQKKTKEINCPIVSPTEKQTINNPAGDNTCIPSYPKIKWDVFSKDEFNWGVCVSALELEGNINIKPWENKPNSMTVPNTVNPVDGGNINNIAGSNNHWKTAIDDMKDYDKSEGGAGPNWHSVEASIAHENAHWSIDWVKNSILSSKGGNWNKANKKINKLTESKANSPTKAEAKAQLTSEVETNRISFGNKAIRKYNSIQDTPGASKGAGYKAGAKVLDGLIADVKNYKNNKDW